MGTEPQPSRAYETARNVVYETGVDSPIDISIDELNSEIEWLSDAISAIDSKTKPIRAQSPEVHPDQKISELPGLQSDLRDKIQTATTRIRNHRMTLESITNGMEL